jgi:uncharacterized protein (DUF2147 family)
MKYYYTLLLFLSTFSLFAQNKASDIEKIWLNGTKTGKIKITKTGDTYSGKIVWLAVPKNEAGQDKTDINNPTEAKHKTPIMGLVILSGFKYDGDNVFSGGTIYDPKNGKTYSCKITIIDANNIDVRGYVGFSLLGRTERWTATL